MQTTKTLLVLVSVAATSIVSADIETDGAWQFASKGVFHSCPSGKYALGLCGSGSDGDCKDNSNKDKYNNAMECEDFPVTTNDDNFQYQSGAWTCYESGTQASCGANEVITGVCASGSDNECMDQCGSSGNTKYSFALRCGPIANDIILGTPTWETPEKSGVPYTCPAGQVACGACFSDSDPHCQGEHYRAACCTPSAALNITANYGWWEEKYAVSSEGCESITYGISNEQAHSKTQTWSDAVTASVVVAHVVSS